MKKPVKFILVLLIIISLCAACAGNEDIPDTPTPSLSPEEEMVDGICPPSIMINGEIYYCFQYKTDIVPTEDDISGTIKSVCEEGIVALPTENDQSNFPTCLDQPYAVIDGNVYIFFNDKWTVCTPAD